jgi:protein-tyrosine sulfotransferase
MGRPAPRPAAPARQGAAAPAGTSACRLLCLTYPYSGNAQFRQILSGRAGIICTAGTGLLALCEQAVATWRAIEDRDGPVSALARTSVASMVQTMTSVVLADSGATRWCDVARAEPRAAQTYLKVFPAAKFLCLHRDCLDVMRTGIRAHPWGMAGSPFAPFAASNEGSAAIIAAYWAANTAALLKIEEDHPGACLRVRIEDLTGHPGAASEAIPDFWGVQDRHRAHPAPETSHLVNLGAADAAAADPTLQVPVARVPPQLRTEIDDLSARLGYPGLGPLE